MKRVACILLAALALGAGVRGSVVAQFSGPTMEIEAGFDGHCRSNVWCPVRVVLTNEGTDVEGELRVVLPLDGGTGSNVYSRPVVLPAHSRKAYFLYLPAAGISYRSHPTVQLIEDEALASRSAILLWADAGDRLYGVVSRDPSALNFLSDVAPATGKAVVAQLSLDTLPPDPLGWEALDVLILNDVDTTGLSDEQRRALETWVAHGGHLIVGGGVGAARTVAGLASSATGQGQHLLPVAVTGLRQVDNLQALGQEIGATVVAGPFVVAEADLREGVTLIEQGDLVLLARRPYGAGWVDFLAFDAGLNPFLRWDDNARLWRRIVETRAGIPAFTVRESYAAQRAVNAMPGLRFLSVLELLAFMLVYIALIGPINYLVLRKFRRRELAWLTIPLIILGFTVFAYVTGFNIRGGAAIVHRLGIVYVPRGTQVGRVSEVVGIFSPRRTRYDVQAPGATIRALASSDYYAISAAQRQPLYVVEDGEGATVTGLRVDVGGIQPFLVEGYADVLGVEADLRLIGDDAGRLWLNGEVRCGTLPLKDAVLIVGDKEQRLGDLDAGEWVSVRLSLSDPAPGTAKWGPAAPLPPPGLGGGGTPVPIPTSPPVLYYPGSASSLPERILGSGDYWRDRELYRRYQFLQALFPYSAPGSLPSGVFLMGWMEHVPLPVRVANRPSSEVALGLYVYEVPVAELETGVDILVPPALITRQMEGGTSAVIMTPDGPFYLEAGAEVAFRFTVWPEAMVRRVDELVLELQGGSSYGSVPGAPKVSLWDWTEGDWREQDIGWGQYSIAEATRYVSRGGEIRVRLKAGGFSTEVQILTVSLRGQR